MKNQLKIQSKTKLKIYMQDILAVLSLLAFGYTTLLWGSIASTLIAS